MKPRFLLHLMFVITMLLALNGCSGNGSTPGALSLSGEIAGPSSVVTSEVFSLTATVVGNDPTYKWKCFVGDADSGVSCDNMLQLSSNLDETFVVAFSDLPDNGDTGVDVTFVAECTAAVTAGVPSAGDINKTVRVEKAAGAELSVATCDMSDWQVVRSKLLDASYSVDAASSAGGDWCRINTFYDDGHNVGDWAPWWDFHKDHPVTLVFKYTGSTFSPAALGGINGIRFGYDFIVSAATRSSSIRVMPVIIQDGEVFAGIFYTDTRLASMFTPITWRSLQTRKIPEDYFITLMGDGNALESSLSYDEGGVIPSLDLSADGSPISFGLMAVFYSSLIPSSDNNVSGGFRNFSVELNGALQDVDSDGVYDVVDNCALYNPDQADNDGDGVGNVCEDSDNDHILDTADNCPTVYNPDQADGDGDGVGDACEGIDTCPDDPDKTEPGTCGCGIPDIDADSNGIFDCNEACLDVSGVWTLSVTDINSTCGPEAGWSSTVTVNQSGCNLQTTGIKGSTFTTDGSVSGGVVTIGEGDFPEAGGTTTATYTMIVGTGADNMSGTESWTWTDGSIDCTSGTANISATKN